MRFTLQERGRAVAVVASYKLEEIGRRAQEGDSSSRSLVLGELWAVPGGVVWMRHNAPLKVFRVGSVQLAAELLEGEVAESPKEYLL